MKMRTRLRNTLSSAALSWRMFFHADTRKETTWRSSLDEEVRYWRSLLDRSFPNEQWVIAFHERVSTNTRFPPHLERLVKRVPGEVVRVLDVGSGPVSRLGTISEQGGIAITAIDPLADEYRQLFDEFNVIPRICSEKGSAEHLNELFPKNYFDLVYCRNALDHAYDPLLGIFQMVKVCKVNSYCWLQHAINEGENQGYRGLHQWNLYPQGTDLIICGKPGTREISLRRELEGIATIEVEAKNWCTVRIRKQ